MRGTPVRLVGRMVAKKPVGNTPSPFAPMEILGMFGELNDLYKKVSGQIAALEKVAATWEQVKKGPPGDMGLPGRSVDHQAVVRDVAKLIRQPEDGVAPTVEEVVAAALPHLTKKIEKLTKPKAAVVKAQTETPKLQDVVDAVFEHLDSGKKKIKLEQVDGIENKFAEVRNAAAMGSEPKIYGKNSWERGGGDTVKAGTGVTITTNEDGNKVINAVGGGGSNVATQKLTPTQAGSSITLDLTGLAHTFSVILGVYKNGQLLDPSDPQFGWSRVGNTTTVLNGFDTDVYLVQYTYA